MAQNVTSAGSALTVIQPQDAAIAAHAATKGDLSQLTDDQRTALYGATCRSMGLNPLARPFEYIKLNGRLTLYATRTATDQLRKINGVSVTSIQRDIDADLCIVTVRVRDATGREDEEVGAVTIAGLKGEARANAIMKAITKGKRRATLSICGLGWLDETEVGTIPSAELVAVDRETGEIVGSSVSTQDDPRDDLPSTAEEYRERQNRRLHALVSNLGDDHSGVHALMSLKGYASVKDASAASLKSAADWIESKHPNDVRETIARGRIRLAEQAQGDEPPADAEQVPIEPDVLAEMNADLDRQQTARRYDG